jgi:sugar phosphate isomerase/epimerase
MKPLQVGVCTWSLNRGDVREAMALAQDELGLSLVQLGFFGRGIPAEDDDAAIVESLGNSGLEVSATCAGFEGEDYSTIASIRRTGGYAPDETFEERFRQTCRVGDLTAKLGVRMFTVHVGFIPEDAADPKYAVMLERVGRVADALDEKAVTLTLETGQETARTLAGFLNDLGRDNVKINFDPGNMILYGVGPPAEALHELRPYVAHLHVKDALWSDRPGVDWGAEVPVGTGDADIPRVISKLRAGGYAGPLIIERETGRAGGLGELKETVRYLESMGL